MALSKTRLKIDSEHDALYKKRFKNRFFFQKLWSKSFLSIKRTFSATTLARKHKKACFDVFTVKID